jgi:hypothetical protein
VFGSLTGVLVVGIEEIRLELFLDVAVCEVSIVLV